MASEQPPKQAPEAKPAAPQPKPIVPVRSTLPAVRALAPSQPPVPAPKPDAAKALGATVKVAAQDNASASDDVAQQKVAQLSVPHIQRHKEVHPIATKTEAPPKAPTPASPAHVPAGFELPPAIYSPQLLESVTYDIQYYLDWYRQNQIRKEVGAKPKDEPNHSDETVLVIEAWLAGQPPTLEKLEALLDYLKHLKLPEVHIMLAALPNRTQRETLVAWLRNNATTHLLVSFTADRNLGGGIVLRTPNHIFDYSWKQQLVAARDKLAGIIKRV